MKKRITIRAHGSKDPTQWFSGGLWLLEYFHEHKESLDGEIVCVVSPFERGSVAAKIETFNKRTWRSISHICLSSYTAKDYESIEKKYAIDLHFFSWWLKFVRWLKPLTAINIHPWPIQPVCTPDEQERHFGGKWMRGDHVHRKVRDAYQGWIIKRSVLSMHYITNQFDDPRFLIWQVVVPLLETDSSWEQYKKRARLIEPSFQQYVCGQLANGNIRIENEEVVIEDEVEFVGASFGEFAGLV